MDHRAGLETVVTHANDLEGKTDYHATAAVVAELAACGDRELVPYLLQELDRFLEEGNFYGRDLVGRILGGIEGTAALPVLLRAAARDLGDDQDGFVHEITELMQDDPESARQVVLGMMAGEPGFRRKGLWALGYVVQAEDVQLLVEAMGDPNPEVRSTAVGSLPRFDEDDQVFRVVVGALSDVDELVRCAAVSRLAHASREDVVGPLMGLVGDPSPSVRSMVAYGLGRHNGAGSDVVEVLRRLAQDPVGHVRESAERAVRRAEGVG